jgi:hypothetical protein
MSDTELCAPILGLADRLPEERDRVDVGCTAQSAGPGASRSRSGSAQ